MALRKEDWKGVYIIMGITKYRMAYFVVYEAYFWLIYRKYKKHFTIPYTCEKRSLWMALSKVDITMGQYGWKLDVSDNI